MTVRRGQRWELVIVILAVVFVPGIASAQKSILPKECVDCHGSEAKYPVRGVRSQYLTSGHKNLGNASYANSDDCQGCHTHEGFIERVKKGTVDTKKFVRDPSEIGCFTCHAPHETGNFSLRMTTAVKLANGVTFDRGKGNLCASCHQARRTPQDEVKARAIPTSSWGAHHGPQADMLTGTNAFELPGKKYSKSVHANLPKAECVTCHMTLPNGRYSFSPAIGGHSFSLEGEVHEQRVVNTAGCLTSGCHNEMKQVKGAPFFDRKAPADYDGNGKTETIQQEVQGLYERLINSKGTGLLQMMNNPIYDTKGNFIENNKTQYPIEVVGALYNYKFVKEDGSKGIHNATYA
ncbi:MAG: hypothetical protein ACM37Z_19155, partial [Deltaproteobacteria bacterium]